MKLLLAVLTLYSLLGLPVFANPILLERDDVCSYDKNHCGRSPAVRKSNLQYHNTSVTIPNKSIGNLASYETLKAEWCASDFCPGGPQVCGAGNAQCQPSQQAIDNGVWKCSNASNGDGIGHSVVFLGSCSHSGWYCKETNGEALCASHPGQPSPPPPLGNSTSPSTTSSKR